MYAMKHFYYPLAFVLIVACLAALTCHPSAQPTNDFEPLPAYSKYDRVYQALLQDMEDTKDRTTNTVPRQRLLAAKAYADRLIAQSEVTRAGITGISWEERGPNNVGGRSRALHMDYYNLPIFSLSPGRLWAGSTSGGLWSSEDINAEDPEWAPADDFFANLSITCITQDTTTPANLYFGTGEYGWFVSNGPRGLGIWKSTNGGTSWSQLASTATGTTFRYVLDMEVDRFGNLYATTWNGLQRSTNDGASWTKVLGLGTSGGNSDQAADLEIAANGDIYVSTGLKYENIAGTGPGRVYVSRYRFNKTGNSLGTAGTWIDVTPPAILADTARRIEIACAPGDSNTLYVVCQGNTTGSGVHRVFRSLDGGGTWTNLPVPTVYENGSTINMAGSQARFNLIAGVYPNNDDSVFIGGVNSLRSLNGGASWAQINYYKGKTSSPPPSSLGSSQIMHVDHHDIEFLPVGRIAGTGNDYDAIWATDAGPYAVANMVGPGLPTITDKRKGFNTTQFYSCDYHPVAGCDWYLAGAQDNGTQLFEKAGMNSTKEVFGGDGGFCGINALYPDLQVASTVYNNYIVTENSWQTSAGFGFNSRGRFINPWDYSDSLNTIFASDDAGFFYRWKNVDATPVASDRSKVAIPAFGGQQVSHVKVSPNKKDRVYFGLRNGNVVKVERADLAPGAGYSATTILNGSGPVSCVEVNPKNESHIIVTHSDYGNTSSVRETKNGGGSWTVVEGNLPDMPVRWAVFAPDASDTVLLATELGIWNTNDLNGTSTVWGPSTIAANTPSRIANCRVDMLKVRPSDGLILAATHGRGLWTTDHFGKAVANFTLLKSRTEESDDGGTYPPVHVKMLNCTGYNNHNIEINLSKALAVPCTLRVYYNSLSQAKLARFAGYGDFTTIPTMDKGLSPKYAEIIIPAGQTKDTIIVSVINDKVKERDEKLFLDLESKTDEAVVGKNRIHELTIYDDDASPDDKIRMLFKLGNSAPRKAPDLAGVPFGGGAEDGRSQMLILASDLIAIGLDSGEVDSIGFYVSQKRSTEPYADFTVKMANTSLTTLSSSAYATGSFTTVYSDTFATDTGWVDIPFDSAFVWDGASNILIESCFDNSSFTMNDDIAATSVTGYRPVNYATGFFTAGCSIAAPFASEMLQPEMYFYQSRERRPELGADTVEFFLSPDDTFHITSDVGDMIATIFNGTFEYSCTSFEIDRTGTGVTPFWTTDTAEQLFDKTIYVDPDTNTTGGGQTYTLTLYFTQTELDTWTNATGKSLSDLKIIKTKNRPISDITPAAPISYHADVSIHSGTISTYGTDAYSITATFSGFSGFGLGDPDPANQLPVASVELAARLQVKQVDLTWKVRNEEAIADYVIERSVDGTEFEPIANLTPTSGSATEKQYNHVDKQIFPGKLTYRIRYISLDGEIAWSNSAEVFVEQQPISLSAFPNPFNDVVNLAFTGWYGEQRVEISFLDANGKLLVKQTELVAATGTRLRIDPKLPDGLYFVRMRLQDGKELWQKVVKAE